MDSEEKNLPPPSLPAIERFNVLNTTNQLLTEYQRHTGKKFQEEPPSLQELKEVALWMNKHHDIFWDPFIYQESLLTQWYFSSLSQKANILSQFHCPICKNQKDDPIWHIPIRIPPISKQAANQKKGRVAAFEKAIAYRLESKGPWLSPEDPVCLMLLFVVHPTAKQKDLDNMAKAIIDAIKKILFGDDRRIDHLNIIRLKAPTEEYVHINLRKSTINDHSNVMYPDQNHSWAGAEVLDLESFME